MKKILLPVIMFGVFSFFPIKPMAMVELDENGNAIEKKVAEGEVSILMAPDEGSGDQPVSSDENRILSGEIAGDSQTASSDDVVKTTGVEEDAVKTATDDELYELATQGDLATNAADENEANVPVIIVTSSAVGIALGAGAMYLIRKRKQ
jgi:hypothetical protein